MKIWVTLVMMSYNKIDNLLNRNLCKALRTYFVFFLSSLRSIKYLPINLFNQ